MTKCVLIAAMIWMPVSLHSQARTEDDYQRETEQIALWEGRLAEAKKLPQHERLQKLLLGLRNMGHRRSNPERLSGVDVVFRDIQTELLSIPGHAKFIANEVERLREESQHLPRENQSSYDAQRQVLIDETLRHLPSPETVQVIGHYLDDERDLPPPKSLFLPENAFLACNALADLGLRDAPVTKRPGFASWKEAVAKQRAWYAQVNAGIIPFSFIGQNVEYRFKPDGTWETLAMVNPSDDGPRRINAEQSAPVRPFRRPTGDSDPSGSTEGGSLWPWLFGIPVLLLAAAIWLRSRNSAGLDSQ